MLGLRSHWTEQTYKCTIKIITWKLLFTDTKVALCRFKTHYYLWRECPGFYLSVSFHPALLHLSEWRLWRRCLHDERLCWLRPEKQQTTLSLVGQREISGLVFSMGDDVRCGGFCLRLLCDKCFAFAVGSRVWIWYIMVYMVCIYERGTITDWFW